MANPTTFASARQYIGLAVETTQGTAVVPAVTIPVDKFDPEDRTTWLDDAALRGSMVDLYNRVAGVKHSEADVGGPAFFDTLPYMLSNIFGDAVYSGTYTGSGTTTLDTGSAVGAVSISTVATIPASTLIQIDTGTLSEVRLTTGVSGGGPFTVTFADGLTNAHAGAAVVKPIQAPFSDAYSVLNTGSAQPSSLTVTDYQGPTATTGTRAYPGMCLSELSLRGNAESSAIEWAGKLMGWPSASAAAFTSNPSAIKAQPTWESTFGLNGTVGSAQVRTVNEFEMTFRRELEMIYTGQNSQSPYYIQRGKLHCAGKLNIVAADESALTYLNSNTQPQLQIVISNGLSGANLLALTIDLLLAAFTTSKIVRGKPAVEFAVEYDAVANTTNSGYSAGFSPTRLTVQNAITPTPGTF
jgi:hypothetical protein